MRQIGETELYKLMISSNDMSIIGSAVRNKLNQNVGIIAPEHIESELVQLKTRSKNSYFALLPEALSLYQERGLIRLFNLGTNNDGRSDIPLYMPFIAAQAKSRVKEASYADDPSNPPVDRAIFVNMFRIGNWSVDESSYNNLNATTDLYACLETGVIAYKLTIQHMADKVFSDREVIANLLKLYTSMVKQTIIKTKVPFGQDFQNDASNFIISKFFLLYCLGKQPGDMTDDYAYGTVELHSSLESLKSFEDISNIDYGSLSGFLKTFGIAFFNEEINLMDFETNWLKMYGEGMALAIEYVPYLLHFLFAALHGAYLGGSIRLTMVIDRLKKNGLPKLYNAVIGALRA